ncbi:uncharacterized protein LOC126827913 [Patella vulgata]|uniref:uncharacterized protein LOC126827913 n=1 Tax=Patella vulgata TaxID=6465 RepID=UPI00217FB4CA|nr:uncharacterized protein LOC126827913 [Patella vulgata]
MHYKSDTYKSSEISNIQVRFLNGRLSVFMNGVGTVLMDSYMSNNMWTSLAFSYDYDTGKLYLYKDGQQVDVDSGPVNRVLNVPGVLRLANPQFGKDQFKGMMTCLSLYDVATGFNSRVDDVLTYCNATWTSPPPTVPTCFEETPVYLWPLDDTLYGYDVMTSRDPVNKECCFRYNKPHTTLPNNAMMFDGSVFSLVETSLKLSSLNEDFSISNFLYLNEKSTGTIWHISSSLLDIKLTLLDWKLKVEVSMLGTKCADFTFSKVLSPNTWHPMSVQRSGMAQRLSIIIDDTEQFMTDTCVKMSDSTESARFVIGGSLNDVVNFRGSIRCLGVFDSWLHPSRIRERLEYVCSNIDTLAANPCAITPHVRNILFTLFQNDVVPDVNIEPMTAFDSTTFSQCSALCVQTRFCRAFSFNVNRCILYDYVTTQSFKTVTGSRYYIGF